MVVRFEISCDNCKLEVLKGVVRPVKMCGNGKALQIFANAEAMIIKPESKLSPGLTDINTFGTFAANKDISNIFRVTVEAPGPDGTFGVS